MALLGACSAGDPPLDEAPPSSGGQPTAPGLPRPPASGGAAPARGATFLDPVVDRAAHTATLLPDGRVLVVGGRVVDGCSDATASTELFDPAAGSFVAGPDLASRRDGHGATRLRDGDVLLVDRAAFAFAGVLGEARDMLTDAVVVLPHRQVLVAGGGETVETYHAVDGTSRTLEVNPRSGRSSFATATLLGNGSALVIGGYDDNIDLTRTAYLLDRAALG